MALTWFQQSRIVIDGVEVCPVYNKQKYWFLKNFFRSQAYTESAKLELLEAFLGDDKSMFAEKCRAGCIASLPNAEIKAHVWTEITDIDSEDSLIVLSARMVEFYSLE